MKKRDLIKSLDSGLSLYKERYHGISVVKTKNKSTYAHLTLTHDLDSNLIWRLMWGDDYKGCNISQKINFYSLGDAVKLVNKYWEDKHALDGFANFTYELNNNLLEEVAGYFDDPVYKLDKYDYVIHEDYVHDYRVFFILSWNKKSHYPLSVLYGVEVADGRKPYLLSMKPMFYSRGGKFIVRWLVSGYPGTDGYNAVFDSFRDAVGYINNISDDLILSTAAFYAKDKQLSDHMDAEIALLV